jgi:pSer/pThr/pTyr-binding forkhead associated (FHA) protein
MQTSRYIPIPFGGAFLSDLAAALRRTLPAERRAMLRCPALVELPQGTFGPGLHPLSFDACTADRDEARAERLEALTTRLRPEDVKVHFLSPRAPDAPILVGAMARADVLLPKEDRIAQRHAQLFERGGLWRVVDNEAGTWIEGKRLPAGIPMPIIAGQRVRFGERELVLLDPDQLLALAVPPARAVEAPRLPAAGCDLATLAPAIAATPRAAFLAAQRLPFLLQIPQRRAEGEPDGERTRVCSPAALAGLVRDRGAQAVRLFAIASRRNDGSVVVGRGAEGCDVVLGEGSVSKRHAVLRWRQRALSVVDLESRNGTFVDGERLLPGVAMPVEAGETLTFGTYRALVITPEGLHDLCRALQDRHESATERRRRLAS